LRARFEERRGTIPTGRTASCPLRAACGAQLFSLTRRATNDHSLGLSQLIAARPPVPLTRNDQVLREKQPENNVLSMRMDLPVRFGTHFAQFMQIAKRRSLLYIKELTMLWTIFVILLVLWALGMVTSVTLNGFIHLLLVIAIVVLLIRVIQGRQPI
jgi:hypothetical protein